MSAGSEGGGSGGPRRTGEATDVRRGGGGVDDSAVVFRAHSTPQKHPVERFQNILGARGR